MKTKTRPNNDKTSVITPRKAVVGYRVYVQQKDKRARVKKYDFLHFILFSQTGKIILRKMTLVLERVSSPCLI